jgi:peptidoglycan/LPS O-acetylase OafA/YrhL
MIRDVTDAPQLTIEADAGPSDLLGRGGGSDGDARRSGSGSGSGGRVSAPAGYLTMFDFFRVAVCACVLGQHSFLWTDMSSNVVGTGFITMLHFTRNAFFFLSGLVVCYAQITRPRSLRGFWTRRYVQIGVPYLAWTVIYVVFTILRPGGAWDQTWAYFWTDIRTGYYQLYVIIVLFQFYLVFPFLLKLLQATSARTHVVIMSLSVAIALFIGVVLHYNPDLGVVGHAVHDIGSRWVWSRNLVSYQLFFVAGVLVAYHFERVMGFVLRWHSQILMVSAGVGVGTLLWYLVVIWQGATLSSASDVFEPIAVLWSLGAIAGMFALSWQWDQRRNRRTALSGMAASRSPDVAPRTGLLSRRGRPRLLSITYLAELTGGFYFCHILFINMIRAILYSSLIGGEHLPWPIRTATFYVGTAVVAVTFVSLITRTPLRWVLGGPVRAEQRERDNEGVALRAAHEAELAHVGAMDGGGAVDGGTAVDGGGAVDRDGAVDGGAGGGGGLPPTIPGSVVEQLPRT